MRVALIKDILLWYCPSVENEIGTDAFVQLVLLVLVTTKIFPFLLMQFEYNIWKDMLLISSDPI